MNTPPVVSAKQAAFLLGWRCVESFYNNRRKLEAEGFPKKLPGVNGWSRAAILRWIETNGETCLPNPPAPRENQLERRYA